MLRSIRHNIKSLAINTAILTSATSKSQLFMICCTESWKVIYVSTNKSTFSHRITEITNKINSYGLKTMTAEPEFGMPSSWFSTHTNLCFCCALLLPLVEQSFISLKATSNFNDSMKLLINMYELDIADVKIVVFTIGNLIL